MLRRTKSSVLSDLPSKTVYDILCPLTSRQKQLYALYQKGLNITDDVLEREYMKNSHAFGNGNGKTGGEGAHSHIDISKIVSEDTSMCGSGSAGTSTLHPFKAFLYLQLLCIHPSLVNNNSSYTDVPSNGDFDYDGDGNGDRNNNVIFDSMKFIHMLKILIDSHIILPNTNIHINCYNKILSMTADTTTDNIDNYITNNSGNSNRDIDRRSVEDNAGDYGSEDSDSDEDDSSSEISENVPHTNNKKTDFNVSSSSEERVIKKCVIFCEHMAVMNMIQDSIFHNLLCDVRYARLDGSVPASERSRIIQEFNGCDINAPTVLLASTGTCSHGITLVGAEIVIFIEHNWNPFIDLQAMDRVHRIGQQKDVQVYCLLGIICTFCIYCITYMTILCLCSGKHYRGEN